MSTRRLTVNVAAIAAVALTLVFGLSIFASSAAAAITTVQVSIPQGSGTNTSLPGYSPATITVVIGVNNTVTWTNNDSSAPHTVTISSLGVDSGNMAAAPAGAQYTYTFTKPGTYAITCDYHPWMKGTVVVLAGPSTSSGSSTVPEFPAGALGAILLVLVAVAILASGRVLQKASTTVGLP